MVCDNFEKAIEEETIKLIDMYDNRDYNVVTVVKGYYIIDQYKDGELAQIDHPAEPIIALKYCPYCGEKLELPAIDAN